MHDFCQLIKVLWFSAKIKQLWQTILLSRNLNFRPVVKLWHDVEVCCLCCVLLVGPTDVLLAGSAWRACCHCLGRALWPHCVAECWRLGSVSRVCLLTFFFTFSCPPVVTASWLSCCLYMQNGIHWEHHSAVVLVETAQQSTCDSCDNNKLLHYW